MQEVRLGEICQLNLFGNIQMTTQAVQSLCEAEVPVAYFSMGGWFYGVTHGLGVKNVYLRRRAVPPGRRPRLLPAARPGAGGRQDPQPTHHAAAQPYRAAAGRTGPNEVHGGRRRARRCHGPTARHRRQCGPIYFANFAGMIKLQSDELDKLDDGPGERGASVDPETSGGGDAAARPGQRNGRSSPFTFDFTRRNRRPPRDAVNALLSLAYSVLAKDLTVISHTVGFDPFLGFYHQPRFGRAALALDLMEPFRPLIADSAVLSAINTRMVSPRDFIQVGPAVR